jgi:hypothetical protein
MSKPAIKLEQYKLLKEKKTEASDLLMKKLEKQFAI